MDYPDPTANTQYPLGTTVGSPALHGALNKFFTPLLDAQNAGEEDVLAFPGFGFWPKWYAEYVYAASTQIGLDDSFFESDANICNIIQTLHPDISNGSSDSSQGKICGPLWDELSCFPAAVAGQISEIPCPEEIKGVPYDTARKYIHERSDFPIMT